MKYQRSTIRMPSHHSQQGIATILIVVLVGVALTASALGLIHAARSTQEKQISVHAATHAQTGLWTGIEAVQRYLGNIDETTLLGLNGTAELPVTFDSSGFGSIVVKNVAVTSDAGVHRVSAEISSIHADAKASAAIGVVFEINPNLGDSVELSSSLNFYDDLDATGQIGFDITPSVNVDGNVNFADINISQISDLKATGSVTLNSSVSVNEIHSNGNVDITSSTVSTIRTRGNATIREGGQADTIEANGDITLLSSSGTMRAEALGNIYVDGEANHTLLQSGLTTQTRTDYSGVIGSIYSVGDILLDSDSTNVNNLYGEANLSCPSLAWSGFSKVEINGALETTCASVEAARLITGQTDIVVPASVSVNLMPPVPEFALPPVKIDVFELKDEANYIVEEDGGLIKITINNINGEINGTSYFVGKHKGQGENTDALCAIGVDENGNCECPEGDTTSQGCNAVAKFVCLGDSVHNHCITYDSDSNEFTLSGTGVAPGVWWIDGNLMMDNGFNNATLLVTGNIQSGGQYRGSAVNYGFEPPVYNMESRDQSTRTPPYEQICEAYGAGVRERANHLLGVYQSRFQSRYPTNLCDKENNVYLPTPTGNIALAAGGTRPAIDGGDGTYTGGDITIGANSMVYGMTLAGGYLQSGGGTSFFGFVTAAVQGEKRLNAENKNRLEGYTKLFLDSETDFYNPNQLPNMGSTPPCHSGCGGGGGSPTAKLLWSRYL